MPVLDRVRKAWNAFRTTEVIGDIEFQPTEDLGPSSSYRPDQKHHVFFNDRSIVSAIYTRLAVDVSGVGIRHVELDQHGRYKKDADSSFNECLTLEANLDQSPRAFRQDIAMTLFDKGVAAIVPVDTGVNPELEKDFDIFTLRVGEIVAWYPKHVRISLYNEQRGVRQEITLEKRFVSIVENPFYAIMNEPNSTLQRLIRKLQLLDVVDEQSSSGKLDIIIQLPYTIKTDAKRQQAEKRREDIEFQLKGSQYGIAYTDGTEKITQLNRPAENNLMNQIEYLVKMLYGQLGLTEDIMNGTATEEAMLNYFNRTIEPIVTAIVESMQRAFLSKVGTYKKERVKYFWDPFKLVPISKIADIADKFTRNEIMSSNEFRNVVGLAPSTDPKADELRNSNMPQPKEENSGTDTLERNSQNES